MSKIAFPKHDFQWDGDRWALTFGAWVDGVYVVCMVSGEALENHFGSSSGRESRIQAFLSNRSVIEAKAREMIEDGRIERLPPDNPLRADRVLIRSRDFSPAPASASAM